MSKKTNQEIVKLWREQVCKRGAELDAHNDKGGHDWHSLWTGFVTALGRNDLIDYASYMKLGFPEEEYPEEPT